MEDPRIISTQFNSPKMPYYNVLVNTLLCEGECAIVLFYQAFLFRQFFDRPAHRRLFYIQKLRHIYAANIALLLLKHQHSL